MCVHKMNEFASQVICNELGLGSAIDWFGIPSHNFLNMKKTLFRNVILSNVNCEPGTKHFQECTYHKLVNATCTSVLFDPLRDTLRESTDILTLVCNPRPG